MVILRDGFFYPTLTRIMDSFSFSQLFLFIYVFIYLFLNKLLEVPGFAKMQFHQRRVQQFKRLLALVVLMPGFTHNE